MFIFENVSNKHFREIPKKNCYDHLRPLSSSQKFVTYFLSKISVQMIIFKINFEKKSQKIVNFNLKMSDFGESCITLNENVTFPSKMKPLFSD